MFDLKCLAVKGRSWESKVHDVKYTGTQEVGNDKNMKTVLQCLVLL